MRAFIFLFLVLAANARAEIYGPTGPTPLVTGNGFGFATYSIEKNAITNFYAHPYRFVRPDPENEFAEGIETANFLTELRWERAAARAAYRAQSQVIVAETEKGAEQFYFLPFGLNQNVLVTGLDSGEAETCLRVQWRKRVLSVRPLRGALRFRFVDTEESLLALPLMAGARPQFTGDCLKGAATWALISLEAGHSPATALKEVKKWAGDRSIRELAERETAELEQWRVTPAVSFHSENERALWRQSEVVLRMAQSREPNRADRHNNGLIVASLPEGMWFVHWVRDMAYAAWAFLRMGHREEARAALLAYFRAQPVGRMQKEVKDQPYQISVVRYFGNGAEEPFFTMAGSPNVEFDGWGLVLSLLSEYQEKYGDLLEEPTPRGKVYEVARDLVAKPLLANFEPYGQGRIVAADTSIWEEHQWDKKYFSFSSGAALAGLLGFTRIAAAQRDLRTQAQTAEAAQLLALGMRQAFIQDGFLVGTLERNFKNVVDSAALEIFNLGVLNDRTLMRNTIAQMELLRVGSGGLRRVRGDTPYEKHEFLFSNFSLARNFLRLGEGAKGDALVEKMVTSAAKDNFFVPEMYVSEKDDFFPGEIGTPTGSIPMVGYGAGVYIMYLLERETGLEPATPTLGRSYSTN